MKSEEMTKDEKSLLLYFECRATDHAGRVVDANLNNDDRAIAKQWNETGFVEYGRIVFKDANTNSATYCNLSDEAFEIAHQLRRERANRMWKNKQYMTTKEKAEL